MLYPFNIHPEPISSPNIPLVCSHLDSTSQIGAIFSDPYVNVVGINGEKYLNGFGPKVDPAAILKLIGIITRKSLNPENPVTRNDIINMLIPEAENGIASGAIKCTTCMAYDPNIKNLSGCAPKWHFITGANRLVLLPNPHHEAGADALPTQPLIPAADCDFSNQPIAR